MIRTDNYKSVLPFVDELTVDKAYPLSIIEGKQSGEILVDNISHPTVCLWWHRCGFAYLAGKYNQLIIDEIAGLMRSHTDDHSGRLALQTGNDDRLKDMLSGHEGVISRPHYLFRFKEVKGDTPLPEGYELKKIDETNYDLLTGRIIPTFSWASKEQFLSNGFGCCVIKDGQAAACAFSAGMSDEYVDIGVETAEAHRGKGLGKAVARAMVKEVLKRGAIPVWQCDFANEASYKLAYTAGFEEESKHPFYVYR